MHTSSRWRGRAVIGLVVALVGSLSPVPLQAARAKPETRTVDVGTFKISVALTRYWTHEANPDQGYALFRYSDAAGQETASNLATIGVFRAIVPPEARGADRLEIARAYAIDDISGAGKALLKTVPKMTLENKQPIAINGGGLHNFVEIGESSGRRKSSSQYVHIFVFFPASYAADGALFVIVGREQFDSQQTRADELDRMQELAAGIR